MMGGMAGFMVANRNDRTKEGTLFLDPGFPGAEDTDTDTGAGLPLI